MSQSIVCVCVCSQHPALLSIALLRNGISSIRKNKQQTKQAPTKIFRVFKMEFGVWKTSDKELIFHWEIFNQALNVITHERYLFVSDKIVATAGELRR